LKSLTKTDAQRHLIEMSFAERSKNGKIHFRLTYSAGLAYVDSPFAVEQMIGILREVGR
jgi:hypothetical protein